MKVTKYYCDHCGREIDERDLLHTTFGGARVSSVEADLCPECVEKISADIPRALKEKEET